MDLKKLLIKYLGILTILQGLTLLGYMGYLFINTLVIKTVVRQIMRLIPGTLTFDLWLDLPVPLSQTFYFFNITNPDEFMKGAKPILVEMGPYVYNENLTKVDVVHNEAADTITYRQTRDYYFDLEASKGMESDQVTFINIIFLAVAKMTIDFSDADFVHQTLDEMLTNKGEKLVRTATVRELIWDGISIKSYLELLDDPIVQAASEGADFKIPSAFADGYFALLKGRNGTDDGFWTVKSGKKKVSEFAKVVSWKNATNLGIWKGDSCNALNGTDSTIYPPFIEQDTVVYAIAAPICRSISLHFKEERFTQFISTYRFIGLEKDFQSTKTNPDNWCFCPFNDTSDCKIEGLMYLNPCFDGAPLIATKPHFLGITDPWVLNSVIGLYPDEEDHDFYIDFHPMTGAPIQANGRIQLNMELIPYLSMPSFANARHGLIPFAWVNEHGELNTMSYILILLQSFNTMVWDYGKFVLTPFSFILILIGALYEFMRQKRENDNLVKTFVHKTVIERF